MIDWSLYPNFSEQELSCSHCGACNIHPDTVQLLQDMRDLYRRAIYISSGYRCPKHPVEAMKDKAGEHTYGYAADIICYTESALTLIKIAQDLGVDRIGLHQKGRASGRYMHVGIGDKYDNRFARSVWTY